MTAANDDASHQYDRLARFYDLVVGDEGEDVALYAEFARRLDAPVLELAAGTGRVAIPLAAGGFDITGIDSSPEMLKLAQAKAKRARVSLRLAEADLCDYRFPERFGLILCAADSFLHLLEPERQVGALRLAAEHLAPEGRLILDLPTLTVGHWGEWEPGVRPLELVWSGPGPEGGTLQHFQTFSADPATQRRRVTHVFDETDQGGTVRRTTASYDLRFIFPAELPLLAAAAGLRVVDVYGDYDLTPFMSGCERMIAVLGKE